MDQSLPAGPFSTIVADPPWPYRSPGKFGQTLEHRPNRDATLARFGAGSVARYGKMSLQQLEAMPVERIAAPNAHLYLWSTNHFLVEAHRLAVAWGFTPKTVITWVKVRRSDGKPSMRMGYYFRGATEHIIFAVRGRLRLQTRVAYPTAFLTHRLPHSVKPQEFYDLAETCSPGPRLELFARQPREGWTVWGDEV